MILSSILTAMWQDDVPQITAIREVKGLFPFRSELKSAPMTPEYMVFIKNKINCHNECLNEPITILFKRNGTLHWSSKVS